MGKKTNRRIFADEEILSMDNVSVADAADYLDKSKLFIMFALQDRRLPFGAAVQMPGGKWSYSISPGALVAYKNGTLPTIMLPEPIMS